MIGKLLKYNRIKQQKKQEEICSDICSISYYSKIENNKIQPPEELLYRLLNRLHITKDDLNKLDNYEMKQQLLRWHRTMIAMDIKNAEKQRADILEKMELFLNEELQLLYYLFTSRFALLKEDISLLKMMKQNLGNILPDAFSEDSRFYYYKIHILLAAHEEKFSEAKNMLEHAYELEKEQILSEIETEDLYVMIGQVSIETGDYSLSIEFTKKALASFDNRYDLFQSGMGRLTLAKAYCLRGEMKQAEKELHRAEAISSQMKLPRLQAEVYQQKGQLAAKQNKRAEAIGYFQQSYRMRAGRERLVTIHGILLEFEKMEAYQDILSWVAHGLETIAAIESERELTPFEEKYKLKFRYYLYTYGEVSGEEFEEEVISRIIPFFQVREDFISLAYYAERLAEYFEKQDKLDKSLYWMKQAVQALTKRS